MVEMEVDDIREGLEGALWRIYKGFGTEHEKMILLAGSVIIGGLLVFLIFCKKERKIIIEEKDYVVKELKEKVSEMREFVVPRKPQRFRKRDRVWFYGRRLMRRMEDNIKHIEDVRVRNQNEGKKMIKSLAKKIIGDSSDTGSNGERGEGRPAEDYLEEEDEGMRGWVPPELQYLLNSFHMLGEFDATVFNEIYPHIETVRVPAGQFLFRIGEPDVNIFVVQNGRLDVTTSDEQGTHEIKKVGPGESLTSLLSFIDMLTGHAHPYRTVQARAGVDSVVLRLSVEAFLDVFDKSPDLLIRVVQMIMARVHRVVFVALHQFLGLSKELLRSADEVVETSPAMSLQLELALAQNGDVGLALDVGVLGLQRELDLEDDEYLRKVVQVCRLQEGETLMTESSYSDAALVFVIQGELKMFQLNGEEEDELYSAASGECVGQLAMLTGEANFYTCRAKCASLVALLSKQSFFSIVSSTPEMVLSLAHSTISRLSPLVRRIDFALDWVNIEGGKGVIPPIYQERRIRTGTENEKSTNNRRLVQNII